MPRGRRRPCAGLAYAAASALSRFPGYIPRSEGQSYAFGQLSATIVIALMPALAIFLLRPATSSRDFWKADSRVIRRRMAP